MFVGDYGIKVTLVVWVLLSGLRHSQGAPKAGEVVLETNIIKDILLNNSEYVKEARPVTSANQSLEVTVYPYLIRIEDIDEVTNTFTATLILMQMWTDVRLAWDETKYGGVDKVRLSSAKVWLPDIVPYNKAATPNSDTLYEETVVVTNTGGVKWFPVLTVSAKCPLDVTNFPFDSQTCTIGFGSWYHEITELNMKFFGTELKATEFPVYEEGSPLGELTHPSWDIVDDKVTASIKEKQYGSMKFTVLGLTAHVKRRASFYKYLAIGPGALIGFLVPVMFLLPTRSQEKNTFGMLMMIGLVLLISLLTEAVPLNHSSTPRVGLFYLITLVLITFSLIISILVSNLSYRGARRRALPQWIHRAFLSRNVLRRILCIDQYAPVDNLFTETMRGVEDHSESTAHVEPDVSGLREMQNLGTLESRFKDIDKYLRYICGKMSAEDTYRNVNSDWEELARVVDRVLFVIFFILYALTAVSLLT